VSLVGRFRLRYRRMQEQVPSLRVPYFVAPLHRGSALLFRRRFRAFTGSPDAAAYLREIETKGIAARLGAADAEYKARTGGLWPGSVYPAEGAFLYALVRSLRPHAIVETGTASGFSTTYLLAALERNELGRLISIDLPFALDDAGELRSIVADTSIDLHDSSPVPVGEQPGWAIPDDLRGRWELRLGDARDLLPAVLTETGELGIFFHDSLHTREHMLFEFEAAWPHLVAGGVLVADDVFQRKHDALPEFARRVGRRFTTFGNLGLIRK
jgi:predicted O-methyltransferase YrrM